MPLTIAERNLAGLENAAATMPSPGAATGRTPGQIGGGERSGAPDVAGIPVFIAAVRRLGRRSRAAGTAGQNGHEQSKSHAPAKCLEHNQPPNVVQSCHGALSASGKPPTPKHFSLHRFGRPAKNNRRLAPAGAPLARHLCRLCRLCGAFAPTLASGPPPPG